MLSTMKARIAVILAVMGIFAGGALPAAPIPRKIKAMEATPSISRPGLFGD